MAKLYFNYSTMNAGKSTMLLQAAYNYEERGMRVVLLIAAFDERAGKGIIGSRIGLQASAVAFEPEADLQALIGELGKEGEPIACVFVDGRPAAGVPLKLWDVEQVEAVEIYTNDPRSDLTGTLRRDSRGYECQSTEIVDSSPTARDRIRWLVIWSKR